jgi:hypothetical protein
MATRNGLLVLVKVLQGSAFNAEINAAIAAGNAIASSVIIQRNGARCFRRFSWFAGAAVTTASPNNLQFSYTR